MDLKTIEKAAEQSLIEDRLSRKSDFKLYTQTLKNLGYNVKVLEDFFNKNAYVLPSFESVTRVRRKIQEYRPELRDAHVSQYRKKIKEPEFIEYSKTDVK